MLIVEFKCYINLHNPTQALQQNSQLKPTDKSEVSSHHRSINKPKKLQQMMTDQPELQQQLCQLQLSPTATNELVFSSPLETLNPNTLLEHPDSATSIILSLAIFILALASFVKVLVPVMLQSSNKRRC